jgi:hypothetical protein
LNRHFFYKVFLFSHSFFRSDLLFFWHGPFITMADTSQQQAHTESNTQDQTDDKNNSTQQQDPKKKRTGPKRRKVTHGKLRNSVI